MRASCKETPLPIPIRHVILTHDVHFSPHSCSTRHPLQLASFLKHVSLNQFATKLKKCNLAFNMGPITGSANNLHPIFCFSHCRVVPRFLPILSALSPFITSYFHRWISIIMFYAYDPRFYLFYFIL